MKLLKTKKYAQLSVSPMKMQPNIKNRLRNGIADAVSETYFPSLSQPIENLKETLEGVGYYLSNEDGSPFEAIFTGERGRSELNIADAKTSSVIEDRIIFTWYKMQSGRYEVVAYLT